MSIFHMTLLTSLAHVSQATGTWDLAAPLHLNQPIGALQTRAAFLAATLFHSAASRARGRSHR